MTSHRQFRSRDESLANTDWRNSQYLFYEELVPLDDLRGKTVLDHGCGPGHDLVLLAERAHAHRLVGLDVSPSSLAEARDRLRLHGIERPQLLEVSGADARLPLRDASIDFFLSSGVLHHCPNAREILDELWRVLAPGGTGRVMVYNYDSVWVHLYVPYVLQIQQSVDRDLSLADAFRRSTDGVDCPYSVFYRSSEFLKLSADAGFAARYLGAAISVHELSLLPQRFAAIQDETLNSEHRRFLKSLTFDPFGRPLAQGDVAGIDGFYELTKKV